MKEYSYLLKIKPLEPYFFGDENSIRFDNSNRYYVTSMDYPSATTIMGMLRYTILERNGLLNKDGKYAGQALDAVSAKIGSHSFSPDKTDTAYGIIKGVSPVVLIDDANDIYIKCPLNHDPTAGEAQYAPMVLEKKRKTSFGEIVFPKFDAKKYDQLCPYDKYLNTADGTLRAGIFKEYEKVTIDKAHGEDAFVKKCFKRLDEHFSFAIVVTLSEPTDLNGILCHMGRERSSFAVTAHECEKSYITDKITDGYLGLFSGFSYVLGDLILSEDSKDTSMKKDASSDNRVGFIPSYNAFALVNMKNLRALSTNIADTVITRSNVLYNTITAGSVFYDSPDGPVELNTKGTDSFGTNVIIKIGVKA